MQKLLLPALSVLTSFGTFAQIPSGTRLREVSGVFDHQLFFYEGGYRTSQINVIPRFTWGKAVKENTFRGWCLTPGVYFGDNGADVTAGKQIGFLHYQEDISVVDTCR